MSPVSSLADVGLRSGCPVESDTDAEAASGERLPRSGVESRLDGEGREVHSSYFSMRAEKTLTYL